MRKLRAVIYCRFSSDQQREASLDDQIRLCREYIVRQGWELTQVYRDAALSGASTLQPGYQAMLAAGREAGFEVLVSEALDRLSRDQEDVAALYKRMQFAGIRIVTLAEGEINELHVGLKGTMNAMFLRDLAAKTRRGQRGRVEAGKSAGGNSFGYRVVRALDAAGLPVTGEREIDPAEAAVVLRIFQAYADGISPRQIALDLNAQAIEAPRTAAWSASTINGNRARGTGILNNEMYIGRLVWNRLLYSKDPETGRRRSRARSSEELVFKEVPALRIVPQALWDRAKARQQRLDARMAEGADGEPHQDTPTPVPFWAKQRPRYLFSGKMRCAVCGGGFTKVSAAHFGCAAARNKGPTICTNLRTMRHDRLEREVLAALKERLMDPEAYRTFAQSFVAEWNRLHADLSGDLDAARAELKRLSQEAERLVDSIAKGTPPELVNQRLHQIVAHTKELEQRLANTQSPAPRLLPNLADVYHRKVGELTASLARDDAAATREQLRGLVDTIMLIPEGDDLRIEVRGELASVLRLGAEGRTSEAIDMFEQVKMVAGARFELTTFRL